jgi:Bacterial regulatory proteins, luxR family
MRLIAAAIWYIVSGTVIQSIGLPEAQQTNENTGRPHRTRTPHSPDDRTRALQPGESRLELWLAAPTVKYHVRNIYRKLGVANRTEATAMHTSTGWWRRPPTNGPPSASSCFRDASM